MVVTFLFVLILLVALVVNIGQLVNRRVGLQLVADGGAWTGATAMAVQLNAMARLNLEIQQNWVALTRATQGFSVQQIGPGLKRYPVCSVSDAGVATYTSQRLILGLKFDAINAAVNKPLEEAKYVSAFNARDLFPREELNYWQDRDGNASDASGPADPTIWPVEQVPDGTYTEVPGALTGALRFAAWECVASPPPHLEGRSARFVVWYRKKPASATQVYVFYAFLPFTRWLMYDSVFGRMYNMEAVAGAKPVGGSIEKGDPSYVAKMVPVGDRVNSGHGVYNSDAQRLMKVVH
jgi:hypothetical protein